MSYGTQNPGEPYKRITVHEALEMQNTGALIVDVRRDDEWTEGHPTNAIHIEVDSVLSEADDNLPKDKDLLFICAAGVRSGLAAEMAAAGEGLPVGWVDVPLCRRGRALRAAAVAAAGGLPVG